MDEQDEIDQQRLDKSLLSFPLQRSEVSLKCDVDCSSLRLRQPQPERR